MSALVRSRGTPLWIGLYALGLLCVLSFVFFEILDVDGSDFERTPSKVAIKVAEAPHEALKRGALVHGGAAMASPILVEIDAPPPAPAVLARLGRRGAAIRPPSLRALLARSLLADVPPSA